MIDRSLKEPWKAQLRFKMLRSHHTKKFTQKGGSSIRHEGRHCVGKKRMLARVRFLPEAKNNSLLGNLAKKQNLPKSPHGIVRTQLFHSADPARMI